MRTPLVAFVLLLACSHAAPAPAPQKPPPARDWIARSNENAQVLLDVRARFTPEFAARTGVAGIDERISDFTPGHRDRLRQALREAVSTLEGRRGGERDVELAGHFLSGGEVSVRYAGQSRAANSCGDVFRVDSPDPTSADNAENT